MPASLSFLVPDLPSSLCRFCRLLPTLCLNSSCGGLLHHHVFSDALGFCLCWQLSAQLLALVCAHVLIKPKHKVNSWLYHTDFGPSPNLLDVLLALDLSGILILAFYFFFENSYPLAAPSFLLSELRVVVMPPVSRCLLVNACEWASPAGPQAWPRFTWILLLPPAYLPSTIAAFLGQVDSVASVHLPRV